MGKSRDRANVKRGGLGLLPMTAEGEDLARERQRKTAEPFKPRTRAQAAYADSIATQTITFGVGPAGTGKTFVAATLAAEALLAGEIERIIITRPIVEAGEELGFLPGDMAEKTGPYMTPLMEVLNRRLGRGHAELLVKNGRIEVLPLAFMRGRSLEGAMVILDEAQNTTPVQMKMFLTRIGERTRVVVDGDLSQNDLPPGTRSGLHDALDRLRAVPGVRIVRFSRADIVRSGICQAVVDAYSNAAEDEEEAPESGLIRALGQGSLDV